MSTRRCRISAAELNIGEAHFAPAAIDAALAGGVLQGRIVRISAPMAARPAASSSSMRRAASRVYALHAAISPACARCRCCRALADFDKLDGKMQAKIGVRSAGNSQRAIMSNLGGTAFADFQDGAIRGLNVAQMIRSLTSGTLSGWQESQGAGHRPDRSSRPRSASTRARRPPPISIWSARWCEMTGAGTIDLGTKTLAFRVEPKLVMTTEGQGRAGDPVGLGIPVDDRGPVGRSRASIPRWPASSTIPTRPTPS